MNYVKAFAAGVVVPSIILPIVLCTALTLGKPQVLAIPFLHFIPLIWGIWNILYFAFFKNLLPADVNARWLITGAVLGLLIAAYGTFWLDVPALVGLTGSAQYLPLIAGPVLYAILWLFGVKPLNDLLNVKES